MYFDQLAVGMSCTMQRQITDDMIRAYADLSGDHNPMHLDDDYAGQIRFAGRVAHGLITAGFISGLLGMKLPGVGTLWVDEALHFMAPVRPNDTVEVKVEIQELTAKGGRVRLSNVARVIDGPSLQDGRGPFTAIEGESIVSVPKRGLRNGHPDNRRHRRRVRVVRPLSTASRRSASGRRNSG